MLRIHPVLLVVRFDCNLLTCVRRCGELFRKRTPVTSNYCLTFLSRDCIHRSQTVVLACYLAERKIASTTFANRYPVSGCRIWANLVAQTLLKHFASSLGITVGMAKPVCGIESDRSHLCLVKISLPCANPLVKYGVSLQVCDSALQLLCGCHDVDVCLICSLLIG